MDRNKLLFSLFIMLLLLSSAHCWAEKDFTATETAPQETAVSSTVTTVATPEIITTPEATTAPTITPAASTETTPVQIIPKLVKEIEPGPINTYTDPTNYTLGPEDTIDITVLRHPEFSGIFPVNLEGKVQYKFVGDIDVNGLSKSQLEQKIQSALSKYVIKPDVTVTILDYKSKVIFVLGEVAQPGKYYTRSESIPVREAVLQAGLPTLSAAMRRCQIITPDKGGKAKIQDVDLYALLYGGDLTKNLDMHPGDVLYVPATVMAKIIRVINPVTTAVGVSTSGPESVGSAKSAFTNMAK